MKLHAQRAYKALLAKKAAMVWQHKRHSVDSKGLASTVLKAVQTNRMDYADRAWGQVTAPQGAKFGI